MNLTKKEKQDILKVYDHWINSDLNGDVKTYDSYFDDAFHFIGSTANEEFLNRNETTNFFKTTAEQLSGKTKLRNETKIVEKFGELIFITHLFDAWFLKDKEWIFYERFQFTNALQKNKEGWRFIYQHYSTPDNKAQEGETIGYDQITAENLQLREAIQRRTKELVEKNRELEIDGALQRIRTEAIAIEKAMTSGDGTRLGFVMEFPRNIHGNIPLLANWGKSDGALVIYPMDAEAAVAYVNKMITLDDTHNFELKVSIGIKSGEMISRNIGSKSLKRLDYTVIGDTVNTAARFQDTAKQNCNI
ncbi:nuclear transport factor 2 family protein [Patiriisocius sp. Uisw_017]|jgi:ketosteroid isomerase-like protein|uniref:nuclear transport factor 2 family protein n=1 Tax=Patiriisocius sp. Uisw_017 TaxID=3230968 RepID=UPI0039EA1FEE